MRRLAQRLRDASTSLRFWVLGVVCLVVVVVVYFAFLDRYTPYTNDGYVQSYVVQLAPQVAGPVVTVSVENNAFVEAGEPLFQIDPRPYQYEVNRLRAELAEAQQTVEELTSDVQRAKAKINRRKAEVAYAKRQVTDIRPLAEKKFAAQLRLQEVEDDLRAKRALLQQANAERDRSEAALSVTVDGEFAQIRRVEAELALAEYDLERTIVYAPFDGYVTNLQLIEGAYVDVGDQVLTFVDADDWWLVANFRENSLRRIEPGQRARVALAVYPGRVFDAYVESVDWGVSLGQGVPSGELPTVTTPATWVRLEQRFPVRLRLAQTDVRPSLRVGGRVTVTVVTDDDAFLWNGLARLWLRIGSFFNFF